MWEKQKDSLYKKFKLKDFKSAFSFMTEVASVAEEQQHHPKWSNEWNVVEIWLSTHEEGNRVTDKDQKLSKAIDDKYNSLNSVDDAPSLENKVDKLTIYTDGGARGNPGPAASGYVLIDENKKVIKAKGVYLGITTNNQAEYQALKFAIQDAKKHEAKHLDIYMDSLLIINQMKGLFKVKNADLLPHYNEIKELLTEFDSVSFTHVPRALNKLADAAVNKALDEAAEQ